MRGTARGMKPVSSLISSSKHICIPCRLRIAQPSQRTYASAVPQPSHSNEESLPPTSLPPQPSPSSLPSSARAYTIKAGIILSRPPLITPTPHTFETAYHLYQRRLNERLVLPFTQFFYFQRDTRELEAWRTAKAKRNGVAGRDVGGYDAHGSEAWNDEALVGERSGEREVIVRGLVEEDGKGREFAGEGAGSELVEMGGLRRVTGKGVTGERSLERELERTVYLLVQRPRLAGQEGTHWSFPNGLLEGKEGLKDAAQRILDSSCGPDMHTWFVGHHPVGHYVYTIKNPKRITAESGTESESTDQAPDVAGEKTFFMKARIMRGQAVPVEREAGILDFKWLNKEEIQKLVSPQYWASIRNMLVAQ